MNTIAYLEGLSKRFSGILNTDGFMSMLLLSIAFRDKRYDESTYAEQLSATAQRVIGGSVAVENKQSGRFLVVVAPLENGENCVFVLSDADTNANADISDIVYGVTGERCELTGEPISLVFFMPRNAKITEADTERISLLFRELYIATLINNGTVLLLN